MTGRRFGLLAAFLLVQSAAQAQDALGLTAADTPSLEVRPDAEMRARVAAEFPDAWLIRFRKIRQIVTEAGRDVEFCGQVSAAAPGLREPNYHLFLYGRTGPAETVRILGAESLNSYRVGRKLIGALRRVGCL